MQALAHDRAEGRDATFHRDAILDARDENLRMQKDMLQKEKATMERERAAFRNEKQLREEGKGMRERIAATEAQLQERAKSETVLRAELQTSWNQMQQREVQDQRRASVTAQNRQTMETQERKIDGQSALIQDQTEQISHLRSIMTDFTADVKATFAEIAQSQQSHAQHFNVVSAELRDLKGNISQVVDKTRQLEDAMDNWGTEDEYEMEAVEEEEEEHLEEDEEDGDAQNNVGQGAPGGAAQEKTKKKTKLAQDPQQQAQPDGDDDWLSSEAEPQGSDDDDDDDDNVSVPGLGDSDDENDETTDEKL